MEPRFKETDTVFATLDLSRVAEEQMAMDAAGHYHRPDIFTLEIDRRSQSPLTWRRD